MVRRKAAPLATWLLDQADQIERETEAAHRSVLMNPTPDQLAAAAKAIPYVDDPERVAADVLASLLPVGYAQVHLTRRSIWMEDKGERQHEPVGGYIRCALIPVEPT